ncbi:MAG TPA: site-2 protease family protein [Gammaproteobacteria bacterium]|jgi:Zn-dependent protease|nr:site-2 protease family protein [Acidiferrobacteraceae bacterium]MDP6398748.1 site-2 protease family protein [Arenicellales bacterium]HCX87478.1 site-2 protease family protein [Gammaproteobacteria bacterium]MDP6551223.1 site-2 protease family protein [Arenicellales bacterium]MDP6790835.1 site-2 protease family protein [Arenicellales bacterium]|tara:strand:+ start:251 stop:892 length:642 start_codon:yes stop_codon:yes gene_type:complete
MISLIHEGQWVLFAVIMAALVISLSFHEFGHAFAALRFGDDTARRAGRLTVNPMAHIDPLGLLMVVFVGFGYAKPVPTNPRQFTSRYAELLVAAAGPAMNLLLAIISVNAYLLALKWGWVSPVDLGPYLFFILLAKINLLLMIFNMLPVGALDGHYILPYFLPRRLSKAYRDYNARYGNIALLALVVLAIMGVPIFSKIIGLSAGLLHWIAFV